jgi:two-component system CheB/CheR fusion protein
MVSARRMMDEDEAELERRDLPRVVAVGGNPAWPMLQVVLERLPAQPGFATIALLDHGQDPVGVVRALAERTRLPVVVPADGTALDPDKIYVVPRTHDAVFAAGRLHLLAPAAKRAPLDRLLRSLADELGRGATGVVLAGSGVDGSIGLKLVKAAGGLALVQTPDEVA